MADDAVKERKVVNGSKYKGTIYEGLPYGMEKFLPALDFARRYSQIVQDMRNPDKTLQDAVNSWTEGVDKIAKNNYSKQFKGDQDYATTLRKRLGFPEGTNLSDVKLSSLPLPMLHE